VSSEIDPKFGGAPAKDILPDYQVSNDLKLLQIKNRYIEFTSIALNSQTLNKSEAIKSIENPYT
jgi:hypothetical protein